MKLKIFVLLCEYKFHSYELKLDTKERVHLLIRISNLQPEDYILRKLLLFTITLVLLCVAPVQAADVNTVKATIVKHAIEMGVDPAIALSIARTESGFSHNARSNHGAVGVFQLMPSTARRMGLNPYSLNDNIKGGIMYYKSMYKMFGSVELALAAYNAGPGNVKKYKAVPPYAETKRFVSKIMKDYHYYKANPDPAMVKARAAQTAAKKPAATTVAASKPKVPAATLEIVKAKDINAVKVEVVDETPIDLEIEATSLAI